MSILQRVYEMDYPFTQPMLDLEKTVSEIPSYTDLDYSDIHEVMKHFTLPEDIYGLPVYNHNYKDWSIQYFKTV